MSLFLLIFGYFPYKMHGDRWLSSSLQGERKGKVEPGMNNRNDRKKGRKAGRKGIGQLEGKKEKRRAAWRNEVGQEGTIQEKGRKT